MGLLELIGSCYAQNIMPFFPADFNKQQLNRELSLYEELAGIPPHRVRAFWPPERVWDTERMAPVLTDSSLLNGGYKSVLIDDRVLLPPGDLDSERSVYDRSLRFDAALHQIYPIESGRGLLAIPISTPLRRSVPPATPAHWQTVRQHLARAVSAAGSRNGQLVMVYADDMEKAAGIGWDENGPGRFEDFLKYVRGIASIETCRLTQSLSLARQDKPRILHKGTYQELAVEFGAGEDYRQWYCSKQWEPYRNYFEWARSKVSSGERDGADPGLIALAKDHLLASTWETAWHTTSSGAHGKPHSVMAPSGWAKSVASHSRDAAVMVAAALQKVQKNGSAIALCQDLDGDGKDEVVLKNDQLFAVFNAGFGGRLLYLFDISGETGYMVIGNPTDDWISKRNSMNGCKNPEIIPAHWQTLGLKKMRIEEQLLRMKPRLRCCSKTFRMKVRRSTYSRP